MKIALVIPHPVPFALGGAENLWWGLQNHIENETPHSCDIIGLVGAEDSLENIVASYRSFAELDLSAYDCVVSTKYPAWMVRHPNHVCYLQHRLRGLYDTYAGLGTESLTGKARAFADWLQATGAAQAGGDDDLLSEFFERFQALREDKDVAETSLAFPGPLARAAVHFLDGIGLGENRIRRHMAISQTVARRRDYFPPGADVHVQHHPPHRDDYRCGGADYFFTSSRLDRPKRLDLLIRAMRHVKEDIPLLIAGTGPDEARLKSLADGDPRIRFLGFVEDDAMPGLYADALAVPFVPLDEDYGLVTIEAMRSGKPVLTCADSGGPTELVRAGATGFITPADPRALAERLAYLCRHRDEARIMGKTARGSVAAINWTAVVSGFLEGGNLSSPHMRKCKPKLTVATTFPIHPPMGGGQARIFNLYREMASDFDVEVIALSESGDQPSERRIAPGLVEIRVPKSPAHLEQEGRLSRTVGNIPIGDIAASLLVDLTPDYGFHLANSVAGASAVVVSHPFFFDVAKTAAAGKALWYEAHNVELDLKQAMLQDEPNGARLLEIVSRVERRCWREASRVFACAQRDLDRLEELYGPTRARLHEVPNGVALDQFRFAAPDERRALQSRIGTQGAPIALFMGSWHGPNLDAVEQIIAASHANTDVRHVVLGSVGLPFKDRELPANVDLLGMVDNEVRDDLLAAAHVALNPMRTGSGTNLKMLDYFASGVPVLSTTFGARGLAVEAGSHFISYDGDDLAGALKRFRSMEQKRIDEMILAAREVVEARYSWTTIAQNFLQEIRPGRA